MAIADQNYKLDNKVITESGQTDRHEATFAIEEKPQTPEVPFVLDDIIAACNFLKTNKGIPGTARVGNTVTFALRWTE